MQQYAASPEDYARVLREHTYTAVPGLPLHVLLDALLYIMADDEDVTIDFVSLGMFILGTMQPLSPKQKFSSRAASESAVYRRHRVQAA